MRTSASVAAPALRFELSRLLSATRLGLPLAVIGVLALVAALFWFGGRSDTLSGLGGPGRDERWSLIDLRASAFAGMALVCVLIGAWLWELAHGEDGSPYGQLMAAGGVAYIVAVAVLRRRS